MSLLKLTAALLTNVLLLSVFIPSPPLAATESNAWSQINIPTEGRAGGWVMASGSSVKILRQSPDGTLYVYATPSGTAYTLFKSVDRGASWSYTGQVKDAITDIFPAPDNAAVIFYATAATIYKSTDAGKTFTQLAPPPGGAGTASISITSVAVIPSGTGYHVFAATRDADAGEFGGVYLFDESSPYWGWKNTGLAGYDIYKLAVSPEMNGEPHLAAVGSDDFRTVVTTRVGEAGWGAMLSDAFLPFPTIVSADIAFPDDYGSSRDNLSLFLGVNTGTNSGDTFLLYHKYAPAPPVITDLNIGLTYGAGTTDVSSVTASGNAGTARVLAGAAATAQVFASNDGGVSWKRSSKPPAGASKTLVLLPDEHAKTGEAYAASSGAESAFSSSKDNLTWNQISLINSPITNVIDLAASPHFEDDHTLFILTLGSKRALWRTTTGGERWERIFADSLPGVSTITRVLISPDYGDNAKVIFVLGTSGNQAVWKSTDAGQSYSEPRFSYDPESGTPFTIHIWAAANDNTLFVTAFDGINGLVYASGDGGVTYSSKSVAGGARINSISLFPDYGKDNSILLGNITGGVYLSDDGSDFNAVPAGAALLTGKLTVAFDTNYADNNTIYAGSDDAGKGIYRYKLGQSSKWESIDATLPAASTIAQLSLSPDGILYGANSKTDAGMERCLEPVSSGQVFQSVAGGLDDAVRLGGLWTSGSRLFSLDMASPRIFTYLDSVTKQVFLVSPADKTSGIVTDNAIIDWEAVEGATAYKWQIDSDNNFSSVPAGFEDTSRGSSVNLPVLEPNTTYYWRVRVSEPVSGPWSAKASFNTRLAREVVAPKLISPEAGALKTGLKPVFQWSAMSGAKGYEIVISIDTLFAKPVVLLTEANAVPANVWQCETELQHSTIYYWKVRASDGQVGTSEWSSVSAFTTIDQPAPAAAITVPEIALGPVPAIPPTTSSRPVPVENYRTNIPEITILPQPAPQTPEWVSWMFVLGAAILMAILGLLTVMAIYLVKLSRR